MASGSIGVVVAAEYKQVMAVLAMYVLSGYATLTRPTQRDLVGRVRRFSP